MGAKERSAAAAGAAGALYTPVPPEARRLSRKRKITEEDSPILANYRIRLHEDYCAWQGFV